MKGVYSAKQEFHDGNLTGLIVIPKSLMGNCLHVEHFLHFGFSRAYGFLRRKYVWPREIGDIEDFCEDCA